MDITITASGTPQDVNNTIATQIKGGRSANADTPLAGATLATLKDYLASEVNKAAPNDTVDVAVTLSVRVAITKADQALSSTAPAVAVTGSER